MEEILLEYGTYNIQWSMLGGAGFLIVLGIALSYFVSKKRGTLSIGKVDALRYGGWGLIALGVFCTVWFLLDAEWDGTVNANKFQSWRTEEGYYIEEYGKVEERLGNKQIQVKTDEGIVEKQVNIVVEGCDFDVYGQLTNGEVWACYKD